MYSLRNYFLNSERISRFAAFAVLIVASAFLLDRVVPESVVAITARFGVSNRNPAVIHPQGAATVVNPAFDSFEKSQIALLKSDRLLKSASKKSDLQSLAIFQNHRDPVVWMKKHLEIAFQEDDGVLAITANGLNSQKRDFSAIVNAVATAYNDVLAVQREMGPLIAHDLLARHLTNLNLEIKRKFDEYLDIERESGPPPPETPLQRLSWEQLQQEIKGIQKSLNEASNINPESDTTKQLRSKMDTYMSELKQRIEGDGMRRLVARHRDIVQHQTIAHDMALKLENSDRDCVGIVRIRQLPPITVVKTR